MSAMGGKRTLSGLQAELPANPRRPDKSGCPANLGSLQVVWSDGLERTVRRGGEIAHRPAAIVVRSPSPPRHTIHAEDIARGEARSLPTRAPWGSRWHTSRHPTSLHPSSPSTLRRELMSAMGGKRTSTAAPNAVPDVRECFRISGPTRRLRITCHEACSIIVPCDFVTEGADQST